MKFGICDIRRREEKTPFHHISSFLENNLYDELLIIGHSTDGFNFYNINPLDIKTKDNVYLVWFYACYCARGYCLKLAKKGYIIIGYIRKIIGFNENVPLELKYIEKSAKNLRNKTIKEVEDYFRQKTYECARDEIRKGQFLLAAIINYNRLNIKVIDNY